jgi:hypothetical protein
MGDRDAYRVWWGNVRQRDHSPRHKWEVKLKAKVKQSHYRPGVVQRVPGS